MTKLLYLMTEAMLNQYTQIKSEMIAARDGMNAEEIKEAKDQIMEECRIHDIDPSSNDRPYEVVNGVARIPVEGMLVNEINFCDAFFGETLTTYDFIRVSTAMADADPEVKKIAYLHNSGGGLVSGVDQTAQTVRSAKKPTVAYVYDMAASASYWLASAADEVVSVVKTGFTGSIGVAVEIITRDKQDEARGIKRTVLTNTTSKDKRPDLLTEEGQAVLVERMDATMDVFVESILEKRSGKLSRESIEAMSGKVFIASKSLELGLVDKIMTIDEAEEYLTSGSFVADEGETAPQGAKNTQEEFSMKLNEFLEKNPDAKAEHDELIRAAEAKGTDAVKADRERIAEVVKYYGNSEAGVNAITDGKTFAELAADEKKNSFDAAKKATDKPVNFGKVSDNGQLPESVEEAKSATEMKVDSVLDSIIGKKEAK